LFTLFIVGACLAVGLGSMFAGCTKNDPANLKVTNDYSMTQYIWLDGNYYGSVSTGTTRWWEIRRGSHTVRATDSADYTDNPIDKDFTVDPGETFHWRIY
jgi:hypothetical protein